MLKASLKSLRFLAHFRKVKNIFQKEGTNSFVISIEYKDYNVICLLTVELGLP